MNAASTEPGESPEYLRMSLAAAMTLGLQVNLFCEPPPEEVGMYKLVRIDDHFQAIAGNASGALPSSDLASPPCLAGRLFAGMESLHATGKAILA